MKKILIKNGRVIDPANNLDEITDILIEGAKISKIGKNIRTQADEIIEAQDKIVMPGIVDMHVHLREPGREDKETIASGTYAAARGGITSVLAMPNTQPAIDSAQQVNFLKNIIEKTAAVNVFICAAITIGRAGQAVTDIAKLKKAGIVAISDDGASVDNAQIMQEALKKAKAENILPICHCEDKKLTAEGVVNLGIISTKLGLKGISQESEYKRVERDIMLAKESKCPLHIAHVSTRESVAIIALAKKKGIKVSAEVTPHHFTLSEKMAADFDTNMKMNPPLRNKEDVAALREGLKNGTIDAIASDHAPHTENEKEIEFERAEFGVIGLETMLAVSITELLNTGLLDWKNLVQKLTFNPAKILGVNKGTLSVGQDADLIVLDPEKVWTVTKAAFVSKSKNSAFLNRKLKGVVEYTLCHGNIIYKANGIYC